MGQGDHSEFRLHLLLPQTHILVLHHNNLSQPIHVLLLGVWGVVCNEAYAHAYGSKTGDRFQTVLLFCLSLDI